MAMRTTVAVALAVLSIGAAACSGAPSDDGVAQREESLRPIPRPIATGCRGVTDAIVEGIVVQRTDSRTACPVLVVDGKRFAGVTSTEFIGNIGSRHYTWLGVTTDGQAFATMFGPFWPAAGTWDAPYCVYETAVGAPLTSTQIAADEAAAGIDFGSSFVAATELCEPAVERPGSHPCGTCGSAN